MSIVTIESGESLRVVRQLNRLKTLTNNVSSFRDPPTWLYLLGAAALGVALHHQWLTTIPTTAADWPWVPTGVLHGWFPWPPVWEMPYGFGFKNFEQIYEFPIFAAAGSLAWLGAPWGLIEKLLYLWPLALLSFISPWLLAREVLGSRRWAILAALLFAGNSDILLEPIAGHVFIALGVVLAPLVLLALLRAIRGVSARWAVAAGL